MTMMTKTTCSEGTSTSKYRCECVNDIKRQQVVLRNKKKYALICFVINGGVVWCCFEVVVVFVVEDNYPTTVIAKLHIPVKQNSMHLLRYGSVDVEATTNQPIPSIHPY